MPVLVSHECLVALLMYYCSRVQSGIKNYSCCHQMLGLHLKESNFERVIFKGMFSQVKLIKVYRQCRFLKSQTAVIKCVSNTFEHRKNVAAAANVGGGRTLQDKSEPSKTLEFVA